MEVNADRSGIKSILIAGYYGFNNTGDEFCLSAMIAEFRTARPDMEITVISGNPEQSSDFHEVEAVSWTDIDQIAQAVSNCDLVLLGGGSIFHDYWGVDTSAILSSSHLGIGFYSSVTLLSLLYQKPLVLFAIGVGPIFTEAGREYVKAIASQAVAITVRDAESREELIGLGIDRERIRVTADPVFSDRFQLRVDHLSSQDHSPQPILAVCLRNWDYDVERYAWEGEAAKGLDQFLDEFPDGSVRFIPFQDVKETLLDDVGVARRVQQKMRHHSRTEIVGTVATFRERGEILATSDCVLGMRLHAMILGIKNHLPVVGLNYDPKNRSMMKAASLEGYSIDLSAVQGAVLAAALIDAYQNRFEISRRLQEVASGLSAAASENTRVILDLDLNNEKSASFSPEILAVLRSSVFSLIQKLDESAEQMLEAEKEIAQAKSDLADALHSVLLAEDQLKDREAENARLTEAISIQNRVFQEKEEEFAETLTDLRTELREEIATHQQVVADLRQALAESTRIESQMQGELNSIKSSRGWKLIWALWSIRLFLIPNGSRAERFIRTIAKGFRLVRAQAFQGVTKIINRVFRNARDRVSRYGFPFRLYREKRKRIWDENLRELRVGSVPGLVSIVLPVYNGEAYLREALESILNQTYTFFELIVVNDGSTDDTASILSEYEVIDERIRVIYQENRKLPAALNHGFEHTNGEYLTWTSHDNRMKPNCLEKLVDCLRRHPSWDMAYANMDIIDEHGNPLLESEWFAGYQTPYLSEHIHLPIENSLLNMWPNNFIGGAFLYRRHVDEILAGYSPYQFTREDYDYWMQINALFTLRHVDFHEPIYEYRFHPASLTSRDDVLNITRDREKLMVFDDFRRDYYLMPLIWILEVSDGDHERDLKWDTIQRLLEDRGQVVLSLEEAKKLSIPTCWFPCVYLRSSYSVFTLEELIPPSQYGSLNVFLSDGSTSIERSDLNLWDACLLHTPKEVNPAVESPKGWWVSANMAALLNAVDIHARIKWLRRIESYLSPTAISDELPISVIICTIHQDEVLEQAIRAVLDQTLSLDQYEIIIVDNDPERSGLAPYVEHIQSANFEAYPDHIRLVQCPILGLSYARNAGLAEAKGKYLIYLDDDSIADAELLENYLEGFMTYQNVGVIGGHILLEKPIPLEMMWKDGWERYWSQFMTGYSTFTTVQYWWEFPWGANWAARREALMQVGGFRGQYGRRGNDFNGGEEIVAAALIQRIGYSVAVLPQAQVIHRVHRSRFSLIHMKQTIYTGMAVAQQSQLNLYIPRESEIRGEARQLGGLLSRLLTSVLHLRNEEDRAALKEVVYLFMARLRVLFRLMRYELARVSNLFHS